MASGTPARSPVRVLQVLTCDGFGGTEHMVTALVEALDRRRVVSEVVTLAAPGEVASRLRSAGVPVRALGHGGLVGAFARLALLLRRQRFDVVNAYGFKSTAVVRLLVRLLAPGTAFVCGVRGMHVMETDDLDGVKSRLVLALERLGSRFVDVYDANSMGALELLVRSGIPAGRMRCIPNGMDVSGWNGDRPASAAEAPRTILCVARFVPSKRHQDLLAAAARLAERGAHFRLVLIGDGPTLPAIRRIAMELGLGARVEFAGARAPEEVRARLCQANVFCLPSALEGMSASVMEAMASGVPVVGTDINGIAELVQHGRTGLLVPPRDSGRLAHALEQLIAAPETAEAFGRAGRQRIAEHFSLGRMVSAKEDLYVSLVGAR
jgi:glycosyltransferase involved in cell wall biosynthesis